jgi:hypothetical protein
LRGPRAGVLFNFLIEALQFLIDSDRFGSGCHWLVLMANSDHQKKERGPKETDLITYVLVEALMVPRPS